MPGESPRRHEEGGQRYGEQHAQNAVKGMSPKEDRKDDRDRMQAGLLAHDAGGKQPAFDKLDSDKNTQTKTDQTDAATWL